MKWKKVFLRFYLYNYKNMNESIYFRIRESNKSNSFFFFVVFVFFVSGGVLVLLIFKSETKSLMLDSLRWIPSRPFLLRCTNARRLFFWTWRWIVLPFSWTSLGWQWSFRRRWRPFSILWGEYHRWRILCCWGSIQRNKSCFCFGRSTFVRQLLWWTLFLWTKRRRSSIFRVRD